MAKTAFNARTYVPSTDADYRALVLAISTALTACGWIKTADTGQIDPATVTVPGIGVVGGYEIRESPAPGGSLNKMILKIEYANISNTFGLYLTLGWASDGAGAISGTNKSDRISIRGSANTDTAARSSHASGAAGYLGVSLGSAAVSAPATMIFGVERMRDAAGALIDQAVLFTLGANSNEAQSQVVDRTTGPFVREVGTVDNAGMLGLQTNYFGKNRMGVAMWYPQAGGFIGPSALFMGCSNTGFGAAGTEWPINIDGTPVRYVVVSTSSQLWRGGSGASILMRYE